MLFKVEAHRLKVGLCVGFIIGGGPMLQHHQQASRLDDAVGVSDHADVLGQEPARDVPTHVGHEPEVKGVVGEQRGVYAGVEDLDVCPGVLVLPSALEFYEIHGFFYDIQREHLALWPHRAGATVGVEARVEVRGDELELVVDEINLGRLPLPNVVRDRIKRELVLEEGVVINLDEMDIPMDIKDVRIEEGRVILEGLAR